MEKYDLDRYQNNSVEIPEYPVRTKSRCQISYSNPPHRGHSGNSRNEHGKRDPLGKYDIERSGAHKLGRKPDKRSGLANQNFYGPVNLRQLGSQKRRRSLKEKGGLVRPQTDGRAPTMLKTDRPSSYVSYGEEYEKQRTRAGHLASE